MRFKFDVLSELVHSVPLHRPWRKRETPSEWFMTVKNRLLSSLKDQFLSTDSDEPLHDQSDMAVQFERWIILGPFLIPTTY